MTDAPVAVVTGGASGLGRALAIRLGQRRALVVLADVDVAGAEHTASLVAEAGGYAWVHEVDVANAEAVEGLAEAVYERHSRCDLLVNNAGVAVAGAVGVAPHEDWAWSMGVNLWGPIHGCHAFAGRMKAQGGGGHIVNVASIAAFARMPQMAAYSTAKAGVVSLSETLRAELAPHGVGVTVVCPAFFRSAISRSGRSTSAKLGRRLARLVERSSVSADAIAAELLDAADANRAYVLPTLEARALWWARRASPERADELLAHLARWRKRRRGER